MIKVNSWGGQGEAYLSHSKRISENRKSSDRLSDLSYRSLFLQIYGDYKRVFRNCQEKKLKKASSEDEAP